jgi:hypothetical protein
MAKNGNNAFNSGPGGNQFLDQTFERGADMVQGRMTNSVAGQGLSNSGVQQMYGRDLNDLATGIYGGAYENNQNRRLQSGMAMSGMQQQARENDLNRMFQGAMASPGMANQIAQFAMSSATSTRRPSTMPSGSGNRRRTTHTAALTPSGKPLAWVWARAVR